jgi:DNA-binding CsgD family transcriptional regulator
LSHLHFLAGQLEKSAAVTLDGMALGESLGGVRLNGAALNSAVSLARLGRRDEAEAIVLDVVNVSGNCRLNRELLQSEIALRRGRFGDAARLLAIVDDRSKALEDVQFRGEFYIQRATLALEEGRPRDAFVDIEEALTLAATTDDTLYTPQMCMLGIQALADRAEQERVTSRRSGGDSAEFHQLAAGLAARAEAAAAPRTPESSRTPQAWAYALMCRAEESRLRRSDPLRWNGVALLRGRGDRARAAGSLRQAWKITRDLGAFPLGARIEQLAQRARVELDATRPDPDPTPASVAADLGLTGREFEVLGYLAAGRSDGQIAEELFISKKTASVHVSNLLRKLDASNRFEAGEIGQRVGLG